MNTGQNTFKILSHQYYTGKTKKPIRDSPLLYREHKPIIKKSSSKQL
jgi:hypothetical protein